MKQLLIAAAFLYMPLALAHGGCQQGQCGSGPCQGQQAQKQGCQGQCGGQCQCPKQQKPKVDHHQGCQHQQGQCKHQQGQCQHQQHQQKPTL